jgi:hypothetical protein
MVEPFFKQPRERDEKHLAWIRTLPCCLCGASPVDPAHLRVASINDDKRETGMGEKPSDKWVLPLCRRHHDEQHSMHEREFWSSYGVMDPFALCMHYAGPR